MATIVENLQKIADSKEAILEVLKSKGASISSLTPLSGYSSAVKSVSHTGHLDESYLTTLGWTDNGIYWLRKHIWWDEEFDNLYKEEATNENMWKCLTTAPSKMDSNVVAMDLSGYNTSSLSGASFMFMADKSLRVVNLSSFNTSNMTTLSGMFTMCGSLQSADLSSFNTSNVTDMSSMFYYCYALKDVNMSSFDTSKVTTMRGMFDYCYSLSSVDLSSFNTSGVTDMSYMFEYSGVKVVKGVLDMSSVVSGDNKGTVKMFESCPIVHCYIKNLKTSLDLSSTQLNVISLGYLFAHLGTPESSSNNQLKLGSTLLAKVTTEYKTAAEAKGWVLS